LNAPIEQSTLAQLHTIAREQDRSLSSIARAALRALVAQAIS
jgi:hypothetical protein